MTAATIESFFKSREISAARIAANTWAVAIAVMAVVFWLATKDEPQLEARRKAGRKPEPISAMLAPLASVQVWRFSLYYFFVFGAFVALALWLPESPRFLAAKRNLSRREAAFLQRLDIKPGQAAGEGLDLAQGNPIKMLFSKGYALQTVLLWVIFFCSLLNLFLFVSWLPEVLHLTGFTPAEAARASSFRELGAIFAVVYLGFLIDRSGPERALALNYAAGIVFIAMIALVAMPYLILALAIFFSGMTIIGSQTGANATCGKLYPARMRTTGIGWALGIGRLGGIAGPALGGYLLLVGLPPRQIFLSACAFALIAALAAALLRLRPRGQSTAAAELAT